MEETIATSSGSPHTPIPTATGGSVVPPPPPSSIRTTTIQMPTTSGSGSIPLMTSTTVPFIQNVYDTPFSYGMPCFDSNSVLTYSTLQTISLGARSSNSPLQGAVMGTNALFDAIPYSGGHIPPSSPLLEGTFQQSIEPNTNYSLFSRGNHGPSSYTTLVGSMPFSLFNAFGKNTFSSSDFSIGGNPTSGQQNPT
jgi:hypothetical protein